MVLLGPSSPGFRSKIGRQTWSAAAWLKSQRPKGFTFSDSIFRRESVGGGPGAQFRQASAGNGHNPFCNRKSIIPDFQEFGEGALLRGRKTHETKK